MFRFEELINPDGGPSRTIEFACSSIQPLGYTDLARARLNTKLTIPMVWENSEVISTDIEGFDHSRSYTMRASLQSNFTSRAISLVKGGWLPSVFATIDNHTIVLVDRNIVSELTRRFDRGKPKSVEPDFLDLFADQSVRINPLLFAMEGNKRRIPTPEQTHEQVKEASKKLNAALPSAEIMVNAGHIRGALGLIEDSRAGIARRQAFLLEVSPKLSAPISAVNMGKRWNEVLAAADQHDIPRNSLVVLAVLSAVVIPNGRSPAKRLLKFRPKYSEQDAYNALCDLRSLEILMCGFALFPEQPTQLCTRDRNLALFWTGLNASNFGRSGNSVTFDLSPTKELIPEVFLEPWRNNGAF
jgi:hypothetical protein